MTEAEIENIKNDYLQGMKYKEIIDKYDITQPELRSIIRKNKLTRSKSEIQKGNQNAIGNSGGHGTEGNKNAVTTGEYETIYDDLLTDEEKAIMQQKELYDKKYQIMSEIKILSIRERRILEKIKKMQDGKEMSIVRMSKSSSNNVTYRDNGTLTTTEAESTINIIQRLEEALTRVQEAKRRYLDSYHKVENDDRKLELELIRLEREIAKEGTNDPENMKDDSFIKALDDSVESTWDDYDEEQEPKQE